MDQILRNPNEKTLFYPGYLYMTVLKSSRIYDYRGLTAVEIVLALALLLTLSGLVIANIELPREDDGPRGSVQEVFLNIVHQAHVLARTTHQQVEMGFDEEKQQIVLVVLPSGDTWEMPLPKRNEPWELEFWRVNPDSSLTGTINLELETISRSRLVFHPSGGTSPAMIKIRQGMADDYELWIEPFSAHLKKTITSL